MLPQDYQEGKGGEACAGGVAFSYTKALSLYNVKFYNYTL